MGYEIHDDKKRKKHIKRELNWWISDYLFPLMMIWGNKWWHRLWGWNFKSKGNPRSLLDLNHDHDNSEHK